MKKPVLIIAGPTASGKSSLAVAAAKAYGGVVINADSMQVYDAFPLLSAQPDESAKAAIPHALYGYVKVPHVSSAAAWQKDAVAAIQAAHEKGMVPIVTGGTGLYLETLMHGLSSIPEVSEEARNNAKNEHSKIGGAALRQKLAEIDSETAARLYDGDTARLVRAYEVFLETGKPLSYWQKNEPVPPPADWQFFSMLLLPDRDALYRTIDERFNVFMKNGALDEAKIAEKLQLSADHPASKTLGLRELMAFQKNEMNKEEAIKLAQQGSRNYAKRQYTWFKNRFLKKETDAGRSVRICEKSDFQGLNASVAAFLRDCG